MVTTRRRISIPHWGENTLIRFFAFFLLLSQSPTGASAAIPPSSINLSVESTAADLAAIINKTIPKELYKGDGGMGTSVAVLRTAPVAVTAADNFVYFTLPVQLTFSYAFYESPPLRAGLRFKARFGVTPDWRIRTELYYAGLSDSLADSLKIGPLTLKPKTMVESITQPVQRLLAPIIDAKVNDAIQLRTKVNPLWQHAFAPILVNKEFSAWLRLSPEKVVMSPLVAANNRIQFSAGVIAGAAITVGPKPPAAPAKPLPPLQLIPTYDKLFHVQLTTDIFFADLGAALNQALAGKTFGEERKITVKGFNLKGEDGRLVITLTTTGAFDGEITVLAKPVYNRQNNSLTFEDVDFDTRNAGWLVNIGSWLFSSSIRSTIKSRLDTALAEQLEKARQKAAGALSSVRIGDHLNLTGTVTLLSLGEAAVQNDHLSVDVIAQGETSISLK